MKEELRDMLEKAYELSDEIRDVLKDLLSEFDEGELIKAIDLTEDLLSLLNQVKDELS
ncbi:MAG: hypothetical protein L7H21_05315 [Sulfolobales archaeon]|nr:hypothetical protein [Sulfolobales archaeon]MCG2894044.1 hypothetical protein [Sulfolobales archaeon]MCG2911029.1 hypothetical protein [Sulfolobales archaeon]